MSGPNVKVYLTAQDAFSSELDRFKRKMGEVAGGMTFTTSAAGKWEEGLRKLASQQTVSGDLAVKGVTQGASWTAGINKASNAVTNLAGNLLGANNQVSNIAEGLLTAFGGGGIVTIAAVGITVLTSAFLYFTKQAREAKKAYDEYMDSLRKPTTLAIVGSQLDEAREKLAGLKKIQAEGADRGLSGSDYYQRVEERIKKQQAAVEELEKQYNSLKGSLYDVAGATKDALALFDANVTATQKAVSDIFEDAGKNWNKIPGVLRDMNAEIATFRQLIASSRDPLEQLQLKERLEDLIKLRDKLANFRAGSAFGASVGGDTTRQGATDAEQAAAIAATQNQNNGVLGGGALSTAMQGPGGDQGLSEYSQFLRDRLQKFYKEIGDSIREDFANTLADAISSAFQTAFQTGNPLKAIQAFGAAMLSGVGGIFIQLGQTYLKYGIIMQALAKLLPNPFTAGAAGIAIGAALIALGTALRAVATASTGSGGGSSRGGGDVSSAQSSFAQDRRENGTLTVIWDGGFADPNDPRFQEQMSKTMELAAERGVTRVRFIPRRA